MSQIFTAASLGDLKFMKEIVKQVTDKFGKQMTKYEILGEKDSKERTILHVAASGGRTPICKYLVNTIKFDVNSQDLMGYTPLHFAILEGHYMTSSFLLGHGANPNLSSLNGLTPLHHAAKNGRKDLVKLLIKKGAEVDAPSASRGTPLRQAAGYGMKDVVKILLSHKANPNYSCHPSLNPLIVTILENSLDCVRILLKHGADPNLGLQGEAPLIVALSAGNIQIIKCLLKAGADPNTTNFYDYTPIEIAVGEGNLAVADTLFDATARIPHILTWSIHGIHEYLNSEEEKTQATRLNPTDEIVLSNRSFCWSRVNEGDLALTDAECCIRLKPEWAKGYYVAGVAYMMLKDYKNAVVEFENACKYDPLDMELRNAHSEALAKLQAPPTDDFSRPSVD
ncbi:uncharacterized protein [Spinacia oleracea]|uniref:Uncharacterized protein isoform X2 n=1 Tax=Spinacia oleracea TaxID=3562 RepID=A0ABM3QN26_SPIOL|nr:uncharacterized protein LOC110781904 isoform X2 [Spinacia oleracea]